MMFFAVVYCQYTFISFKNIGEYLHHSDQYLTTVNSIGLVFNAFARLLGGTMLDYINFKVFMGILMGTSICLSTVLIELGTSPIFFLIFICLTHFIMGAIFVGMPTFYA
jgi:sugar phosphate permease